MAWWNQTPLAWKNLTSDRRKLVLVSGGVSFAVVLMFMQIGFRNALFDNTVQLARILKADLIIKSPARYNLPSEQRISSRFLDLARGIEGVRDVVPIYVERSVTDVHVVGEMSRAIRVVGVPLDHDVFEDPENNRKRQLLVDGRSALLDQKSKSSYRFETSNVDRLREQQIELSKQRIQFREFVQIGTDFVHDGTIIVSEAAIARYFPLRNRGGDPLAIIDFGLVQVDDPRQIPVIQERIQGIARDEIEVQTKGEIIRREIDFWATSTPIGIIFTIGTVMGLVVGTIICYQILYTDITDHLAEFATLKAMGYSPFYFLMLVLQQSLYLTVLGFLPGLLITIGLYRTLSNTTGLIMLFTPGRISFVFGLTLLMCLVSGLLAVRKLWSADPANLFK